MAQFIMQQWIRKPLFKSSMLFLRKIVTVFLGKIPMNFLTTIGSFTNILSKKKKREREILKVKEERIIGTLQCRFEGILIILFNESLIFLHY